jgi:uncharacterized protein YraI
VVVAAGGDFVNVRSGPGTNYAILGQLQANTPADVTGKSADGAWWQIKYAGQTGWLTAQLVQFSGDPGAVAVVSAPAAPAVEATAIPSQPPVVVEQPASTATSAPAVACCKVCRAGKACGDSCISADKTCDKAPGCACNL